MIIESNYLKELIDTNGYSDKRIEMSLRTVEGAVYRITHNSFANRGTETRFRVENGEAVVIGKHLPSYFDEGNTVWIVGLAISGNQHRDIVSAMNDRLVFSVPLEDPDGTEFTVYRTDYPYDVVMGCVNLLEWEFKNRSKAGIRSESLSRYSVTYADVTGDSVEGYPRGMTTFLKPYMKARF